MSELEDKFAFQLDATGIRYEREFRAIPGRRYRWDFRIADTNILIEINGGTWTRSGHSTGDGIARDYKKANLAAMNGWRQLTFTAQDVEDLTALDMICKILLTGGENE